MSKIGGFLNMDKFDLVRFTDNDFELDVRADSESETVWLSLDDMAVLFGRDRSVIGKHVNNALKEDLEKTSVWAKFARTGTDNKNYYVDHYNLDMVISVGLRILVWALPLAAGCFSPGPKLAAPVNWTIDFRPEPALATSRNR